MAETKAGTLRLAAKDLADLLSVMYCEHWNGHYCEVCAAAKIAAFARTELQRQLTELRPWLSHKAKCSQCLFGKKKKPCNCGLDAKLRELGEAE
jgi:hypothetical protein